MFTISSLCTRKFLVPLTLTSILASFTPNVKAISNNSAVYGSATIGATLGFGSGALTYFLSKNHLDSPKEIVASILASAVIGGISWKIAYNILYAMTTQGRLTAAQELIQLVESDSVVSRNFISEEDFHSYIELRFGTNWALALAKKYLFKLYNHLLKAQNLLIACKQEAERNQQLNDISTEAQKLQTKIRHIAKILEEKTRIITQNTFYRAHIKMYEKNKKVKRKQKYEAIEREKDRFFKEHLIDKAESSKINVNI